MPSSSARALCRGILSASCEEFCEQYIRLYMNLYFRLYTYLELEITIVAVRSTTYDVGPITVDKVSINFLSNPLVIPPLRQGSSARVRLIPKNRRSLSVSSAR
jgi:hypothetical protein